MCHAYARTIFLRAFCLRGRLPCRRSRGTRRAPSPQPAAHHHIPPNWKPAQWSRRAAFAMPAAGTGHVRTRQVSPGMTGTQYPSSPLAFSPARTQHDDTNPLGSHLRVTYASLTRHSSAQLRSEHSTADRRASSGREQGGSRDTHATGVVAQVVPIRATLHGYQHVENLLRQRTDESLAARHLDRPVQVWFLVHYMVFCHRVPVSPPRLPHPHPGVSFVDAGKSSGRDSLRFEVPRAARTPSRRRPPPPGDRCEKPIKKTSPTAAALAAPRNPSRGSPQQRPQRDASQQRIVPRLNIPGAVHERRHAGGRARAGLQF
jgi:hypothetical protein